MLIPHLRWMRFSARRAPQDKGQRRVLRTIYTQKLSQTYFRIPWNYFWKILELLVLGQILAHEEPKFNKLAKRTWPNSGLTPLIVIGNMPGIHISLFLWGVTGTILTSGLRWTTHRWTLVFARRAPQTQRQRRVLRTIYIRKQSKTYSRMLWN